ncbi:MAG: hypothetical protein IKR49_02900 [Clostridia bacterium]|nr:hypothetical protein [Clostridia bacterium]
MKTERWNTLLRRAAGVLKQDKKTALLLLGAAALLLLLLFTGGKKTDVPAPEPAEAMSAQALEQQLCDLLGAIEGVGAVRVMLRTASSGETVYAANTDGTVERRDAQTNKKEKNSVVIVKNTQGESGLVVREDYPAVTGAAVVCEGGGDPVVRERIVRTVSALFSLKSNHISVMPM